MDFGMIGPALALGLSSIGSSIGCGIAGMTLHAVISRVEDGHGKFIALSVAPSSQIIYGFILMVLMKNAIIEGSLSPLSGIGIGATSGLAFLFSAIYQGKACATGIQATAKQPSVFGKTFIAVAAIESFALFSFVFALFLL